MTTAWATPLIGQRSATAMLRASTDPWAPRMAGVDIGANNRTASNNAASPATPTAKRHPVREIGLGLAKATVP